jgi:hypothetical protein
VYALAKYTCLCGVSSCGSEPQGYRVDGSRMEEARIVIRGRQSSPCMAFGALRMIMLPRIGISKSKGSRAAPRARSTDSASPRAILLPHLQWWGRIEDFPRTLMRGSPACAVEPVPHPWAILSPLASHTLKWMHVCAGSLPLPHGCQQSAARPAACWRSVCSKSDDR